MSARVLLVEDEPGLVLTLGDRLRREGYEVETAADGPSGFARAAHEAFDVILLDVMLPGRSGLDVLRDLRQRGVATPVLMLTARGQIEDRVVGLKLGADDYVVKPFAMAELLARIEARLRRPAAPAAPERYAFGDVDVDFRKAEVRKAGAPVEITARELSLLRYFIVHREATVSRDELLDRVWGYQATPSTRTVDVHVAALRRKIEDDPPQPRWLLTVHGLGYKFVG